MRNEAGRKERRVPARGKHPADPADDDGAAVDHHDRARSWQPEATIAVTALYQGHAMGFIRLAVVMLGDRTAAEDVVQDAYCGLYRRWHHLDDPGKALQYVRSAVLNGCRSQLRARIRAERRALLQSADRSASPEDDALIAEDHREVLAALRRLPPRQREALVLRFYLDLSEPDIAAAMGISRGTVKSTTSRALFALSRLVQEDR